MLQLRFPALPFFSHAPFYGPEWEAFALAVQTTVEDTTEPASLLLQRAMPELSSQLESSRSAILHNSQQLASQILGQLAIQNQLLDKLLHHKVPLAIISLLPDNISIAELLTPASRPPASQPPASQQGSLGPPIVTSLARLYTVEDVWREWKEGLAGQPALQELEEKWGHRWRPGNKMTTQFSRRKVVWDEVRARMGKGTSEEEAVREVEGLRAGRSINQLVEQLTRKRKRQ